MGLISLIWNFTPSEMHNLNLMLKNFGFALLVAWYKQTFM